MQGQSEGANPFGRRDGLALAVLALVTLLVHARGLAGELVHDDLELIARNPGIAEPASLWQLVGAGSWDFLGPGGSEFIGYWRPLATLAYALVWPLARAEPAWFHALSLAFHLAATVAAFLLARRLVGSQPPGQRTWLASATAAIFALHPVQVESVAWISAMNGPLSGCLVLFSLERFLAWRERGSRGVPLVSAALFALALLAKEMAAALLPLVVTIDLLRADRARRRAEAPGPGDSTVSGLLAAPRDPRRAYGPFAVVFVLYLVARMLVFRSPWGGLERTVELTESTRRLALLRLEIFGGALEILAVPIDLELMRPFRPYVALLDPTLGRAAVFAAVYLALLVASVRARSRLALTALAFIPLGFLPVLTHVHSLGAFPLSERFLYLPAFGVALSVALLLARAFRPRLATAVLLGLVASYAAQSVARTGVWHDEEALFRDTAARAPRSVGAWTSLGRVLLASHVATRSPSTLAEAHAAFERAAALLEEEKRTERTDLLTSQRDFLNVNLGLAACAIQAGDYSAAILMLEELARRVESIQDGEREARARGLNVRSEPLELHRVYTVLGTALRGSGQLEQAEQAFARALELFPSFAEAHQNLGRLYIQQERWQEAVRAFESAARLRPGVPEDRLLLAQARHGLGEYAQAEALARELLAELPERTEPLLVLAACALSLGNTGDALTWLDRTLALDPRNDHAWYQKARALLARGDRGEALAAFRNAAELAPTSFEAHYDLAAFLLAQGAQAEARPYLLRAYALAPAPQREPLRRSLEGVELDEAALLELTRTDAARGELESALRWVDRVLARAPAAPGAGLERARLLRRLGRDDEALAAFRKEADAAPESFEIWSELAGYLHALERDAEARPVIERALELELPPSYPPDLRARSKERLREMLE